jgi:D-glycerate 3-kinase
MVNAGLHPRRGAGSHPPFRGLPGGAIRAILRRMIDPRLLDVFAPLARRRDGRPAVIGIAGAQGSGKSTLARALVERYRGAGFSLDDVYRTREERAALARDVHPLLAVRGPPGTHDLDLAHATLDALVRGERTALPRFDKLADDRVAPLPFIGEAGVVVLDGWCLGAAPQPPAALAEPVNALERDEDPRGVWRRHVNAALAGPYQVLFGRMDAIVHLAAPGFEVVLDWRCEQEAGLRGLSPGDLPVARRSELARFIQHYERITRHMLAGGVGSHVTTLRMTADRQLA